MDRYEFLEKARKVHGFKYSYPLLSLKIKSNDLIDILLGDSLYTQRVVKHLMGRCPEKNTPSRTTEDFIKESKEIWGDKYDYSLVEYKGALKKVKIIYDGIVFEQLASSHLRGLAVEGNMNLEYFIKKATNKWGKKYDYSLVDYKHCKEKVKVILRSTGQVYEQCPYQHLISAPEKRSINGNTDDFIKRSNILHNFKYDYSKTFYSKSSEKVIIICHEHGEFEQVANSHLMGMGCKKCGDKDRYYKPKYSTEEFIMDAKLKWGNKYDYSLTEYKNSRTKIKVIYDGIVYEQSPMGHLKYPVEGYLNQEIFLIKSKRKWGNKYDYSLVEFVSSHHLVKIIYNGKTYEQYPHNHLIYAPELRNKLTLDEFIKYSKEIHNNKYSYDKSNYINHVTKTIITCPLHGDFYQRPGTHIAGAGCKRCNDSKGEREIGKFLDKYKIDYIKEHIFSDCKNISYLKYDFYIPSMRTVIEFDGIQHFQPVSYFGGIETYEKLKVNDKIKNDYCEENYIDIIRIRYDQIDDIYQILWNSLKVHIKRLGIKF
jgi:very-short-patch-repair endonuclease